MWRPDRLLRLILDYVTLTLIPVWLPLLRGLMDGDSYAWSWGFIGGRGVGGDYWVLPPVAAWGLSILYLGQRGARRPWFPVLMLGWLGLMAAIWTLAWWEMGDELRLRGDTLGIDVPLGWMPMAIGVGFLALGIVWNVQDRRGGSVREAPPWHPTNRLLLWILVGLIPLEFLLLRSGPPHGVTDQMGVVLLLLQLFLINPALAPRGGQRVRALP